MRTLTFLTMILLFPLMGMGQSAVSIDLVYDSSGAAGCDTTGENIFLHLQGSSSGLTAGTDTVSIVVDHDDGSSADTVAKSAVDTAGNYKAVWSNSWANPGQKGLTIAAIGPNGNTDSALTYLQITDSCSVSISSSSTFDTTATPCDSVGQSINFQIQGSTQGFDGGDTLELWVNYDDGNGLTFVKNVFSSNNSYYTYWTHSWSSAGSKDVEIVMQAPGGRTDTAHHTVIITDSCATIQGKVYLDKNGDCNYTNGEPLLSYKSVKLEYNNKLLGYAYTDQSGIYQIQVPSNQSPYDITLLDSGKYNISCPSSGTQQVSNPPNKQVDFGLSCPSSTDFSVKYAWAWGFRPSFKGNVLMKLDGPLECQDSLECVKAVLPSDLTPVSSDSASPSYDSVNGDTVIWNMDTNDIEDFEYGGFMVRTDTNATVGDSLCVKIIICASSDADPSNNSMMVCGEVVNSWDPNNKKVMPQGSGAENYVAKNQRMEYTINFQNTGTAPAIDIVIEDTLDSGVLDPNSFRFMGSSHDVDKIDIKEDSIFSFHFYDIMLPDSGTSQINSKGFVRFSVDQQANLADGSVIENNAAIFFDSNPPVITNETMNTIGDPAGSIGEHSDRASMSVHPNPASERLHIRSSQELEGKAVLRDMVGKKVLEQRVDGNRSTLGLNELPSGLYLLSVQIDGQEKPLRKKVMID